MSQPQRDENTPEFPVRWSAAGHPRPAEVARDGTNPIEQFALHRMRTDVASMRASFLVQLRIWPRTISDWAGKRRGQVYNTLGKANGRPNRPMRELLAGALKYDVAVLDRVIDLGLLVASLDTQLLTGEELARRTPTEAATLLRDGATALERDAVEHVERNIAALSASWVFRICVWPLEIEQVARALNLQRSLLDNILAASNGSPYELQRAQVADFLARLTDRFPITKRALDQLVEADAAAPVCDKEYPGPLPGTAWGPAGTEEAPAAEESPRGSGAGRAPATPRARSGRPTSPPPPEVLTLGL